MTPIAFGSKWEAIVKTVTNAGTVNVAGETLTCTSVVGDNAKATRYASLKPGETATLTCMARRTAGADATSGGLAVSVGGAVLDCVRVTSTDWREYSITYTHPATGSEGASIAFDCGVFTADAGTVEFARPRMTISGTQMAGLRVVAGAMLALNATNVGTVDKNAGFTFLGIRAMAYDAPSMKLTVTLDKTSGAAFSSPLFITQMDNTGSGASLVPRAGDYSAAAGTVVIQFYDITRQKIVDIANYGPMFMWLTAYAT